MRTPVAQSKYSIRTQLIAWFLGLSVVPLLLVSVVGYLEASSSLNSAISSELKLKAKDNKNFIDNWFFYRQRDINVQASREVNSWLVQELRKRYLRSNKSLSDFVMDYEWTKLVTGVQDELVDFYYGYDYIYDVFLIDVDGNILYSVVREDDLGTNLFNGEYANTLFASTVRKTLNTGKTLFSDFERYAPSNNLISGFISAPLLNGVGENVGAIAMQLRVNRIFDLTNGASHELYQSYIVGRDGILRTPLSNELDRVLSQRIDTDLVTQWQDGSDYQKENAGEVTDDAFKYIGPNGSVVLGYLQPIKVLNVEWLLLSEAEYSTAFSSVIWLRNFTLCLLAITVIFVIVMAFSVSRKITTPIIRLAYMMKTARTGDLGDGLVIDSDNEIGMLAKSFRGMLAARIDYEKDLKRKGTEARQALSDMEEQRYALSHHAILVITDMEGWIVYANEKYLELMGLPKDEVIGSRLNILECGINRFEYYEQACSALAAGERWQGEIELKTSSERHYWLANTTAPFRDMDGNISSYISIATDITKQKDVQSELEDEKQRANEANVAKSEFLACMSHEIRTPMNGVLGMLSLLSNTVLTIDQQRKLSLATDSANSLLSIINDILDFSKIDAGKMDLERISFNLETLISSFCESMVFKAEERSVEIILDSSGLEHFNVIGDPGRFRQILTNLVGNSIKFTHKGHIVIRIRSEDVADNQVAVFCSIEDSGVGIPQEKIASLFEAFTQADSSTTRQFGGTGLGLSIVKQLCHLMGGNISVESQEGKGSCFSYRVILERGVDQGQHLPSVAFQGRHILVVDDNAVNREIFQETLALKGIAVTAVESGFDALTVLSESALPVFDAAIIDMQMPGMDGAELGRRIRQSAEQHTSSGRSALPLVMMTSQAQQDDAEEMADIGFAGYFSKPVSAQRMFDALAVVFDQGEVLAQAQPLLTEHYLDGMPSVDRARSRDDLWGKCANVNILLVEDNPVNHEVAQGLLEPLPCVVSAAFNGLEALELLSTQTESMPFDIILMDCQMPEMDGFEATEAIRRGNAGKVYTQVPIIAMTANAMKGDKEKCIAAGMNDYVSKPIDIEDLELALLRQLSLIPGSQEQGSSNKVIATENDSSKVWDYEGALKRVRNNPERLNKLAESYLGSIQSVVADLCEELDGERYDSAASIIHSLKGVAGNAGGVQVLEVAAALEAACAQRRKGSIDDYTAKLITANKNFNDCLKTHLDNTGDHS